MGVGGGTPSVARRSHGEARVGPVLAATGAWWWRVGRASVCGALRARHPGRPDGPCRTLPGVEGVAVVAAGLGVLAMATELRRRGVDALVGHLGPSARSGRNILSARFAGVALHSIA